MTSLPANPTPPSSSTPTDETPETLNLQPNENDEQTTMPPKEDVENVADENPPAMDAPSAQTSKEVVPSVGVVFENLTYSVPIPKKETLTILKGMSGCFRPGKLTALMGPSGSGKSTLLDSLAGRKNTGATTGNIRFNGSEPSREDFRFAVGYVEQFDTLVPELSVEGMLRYTADLKLPKNFTQQDKDARVEEVIKVLDLESCRHTIIGDSLTRGISGGQAKRTNIGIALITRPPILFLDEPTSGLDSRVADEVVELLAKLAHEDNRTIVCTIHSPTGHGFSLFDDLYMIDQGETIYDGPIKSAQAYFEGFGDTRDPDASLPEWLVDYTSSLGSLKKRKSQATDEEVGNRNFIQMYQESEVKTTADSARHEWMAAQDQKSKVDFEKVQGQPSQLSKLVTLIKYRTVARYQTAKFLAPRFGDKITFALLIMSLYWGIGEETDPQSIASCASLLYFVAALCGFGASAFVPTLNLERRLFYRELDDGCYSPVTYYFSKFFEEAIIALFTSGVFSVIVFFSLKLTGNFGVFFATYYLTTLIGVILAYTFSAAVSSLEAANALLPTYVTLCLYYGGLFIVFDKIPAGWEWFSWTSFIRFSWGAFMVDTYQNSETGQVAVFFDADGNPSTILEFYGMTDGPIMDSAAACIGMLGALIGFFTCVGLYCIVKIRHDQR